MALLYIKRPQEGAECSYAVDLRNESQNIPRKLECVGYNSVNVKLFNFKLLRCPIIKIKTH